MRRAKSRSLQGLLFALGAPFGWLVIRLFTGAPMLGELSLNSRLYLYLTLATAIAFMAFGYLLGKREEELMYITRRLNDLAVTDALTGLRNARYYHARLDEEYAASRRTGQPFSIIVLDLDFFKEINDEHGHTAGDLVLTGVAKTIAETARLHETAARVGGEEFALLMPNGTVEEAFEVAERIRRMIGEMTITIPPTEENGNEEKVISVTASAGVASTERLPGLTARQLFMAADEALYQAKDRGRNRTVEAVEGMGEAGVEEAEIETAESNEGEEGEASGDR
ncbi:MAG: GGDEF domain-containing protein [Gemmatimonadota bacterium]|jgi:diguanylate cyclase (GGDEF)-like protein|nr:GGDEF domain-containing protein [Gemmatimonadota bacterium]